MSAGWKTENYKAIAAGVSTATPEDLKGAFKYRRLLNVRIRSAGEIVPRPGLVNFNSLGLHPGSDIIKMRKFLYKAGENLLVVQAGSTLGTFGEISPYVSLATGLSGAVETSINFWRPEFQGDEWCYFFNENKQGKFPHTATSSADVNEIGIAPPGHAATGPILLTPLAAPTVAVGSSPGPTGTFQFAYRYKNSSTGVVSEFSALSALITVDNQAVDLSGLVASPDPQVDKIEIFRIGGTLEDLTFVAEINDGVTTFSDSALDSDISSNDLAPTFKKYKPWVTIDSTGVARAGNPLPYVWGPFNGYFLACGSPDQPGTLFWTNSNDPDSMDNANFLEVTGTNEPLIGGFIYDGRAYCFSNDRFYSIYPRISGATAFQVVPTSIRRGPMSPDSVAVGDRIYFVAEDGVFATSGGPEIPLHMDIYNVFPHEGARQEPGVDSIEGIRLPDFREGNFDPSRFNLDYHHGFLKFTYKERAGLLSTLVYDFSIDGWLYDEYLGKDIRRWYGIEGEEEVGGVNSGAQDVICGTGDGKIFKTSFGALDDGQAIPCQVWFPFFDQSDPRTQKLYGDSFLDFDPDGLNISGALEFDNGVSNIPYGPATSFGALPTTPGRQNALIDSHQGDNRFGDGKLARNISIRVNWTIDVPNTARDGPIVFGWHPAWQPKPDDTVRRALEWHQPVEGLKDGYVWGIELWIDTEGRDVTFEVHRDQINTGVTFTANSGPNPGEIREKRLRFTWVPNVFHARLVKLIPVNTNVNRFRITKWDWVADTEAPLLPDFDTNWNTLVDCTVGYVTGVRLEMDTEGAAKNLVFQGQLDGTRTTYTPREGNGINLNGRRTKYFTFDQPFRADLVRIHSVDGVPSRLHDICWYAHPEPPLLANWDETYKDFGEIRKIKGVEVYFDTLGLAKTVQLQLNDATYQTFTMNSAGRRHQVFAVDRDVNGEYPRAVTARLFPTDTGKVFLYRYRYIFDKEPEEVENFNPIWDNMGTEGAKFLQGARVRHDTQGAIKTVQIDLDAGATRGPFSLSTPIMDTDIITLDPPVVTHVARLRATDNNNGFLYAVDWVWEPHPDLATVWITQETTHDLPGWLHLRRGFLAISDASSAVRLIATADGTALSTITVTPSGTGYEKLPFFAPPNKFLAIKYRVESDNPFRLYKRDTEFYVKHWGSEEGYQIVRPFGDQHRADGARI